MHIDGRKQACTLYRARGSIIPLGKGNGTNELWYTVPYHLQPNDIRNVSMVPCVLSKTR